MQTKIEARLIGITQPVIGVPIPSSEDIVSYCARVSNPSNQDKFDTSAKLLKYCIDNQHWSIFEMVNAVVEVEAPRDITRQLLRHRSFSFQEFSQRYSDQIEFTTREFRGADTKNRQNSLDNLDPDIQTYLEEGVINLIKKTNQAYRTMLDYGVAKECARIVLPEGLTMSRLYVNGTLRSWIHYLQVREGNGTQKEHTVLAGKIREVLMPAFPNVLGLIDATH